MLTSWQFHSVGMLGKSADDILKYLSQKIGFDISGKLRQFA